MVRIGGIVALVATASALAVPAGASAQAPVPRAHWDTSPLRHPLGAAAPPATPSFKANLRGGFVTTGNTLLTCPANPAARRRTVEVCANSDNNGLDMRYVNVDAGRGRFDSSTATLSVPDGARVVRAYLYWGADLARGVENTAAAGAPAGENPNTNALWRTALLRTGTGAYTTVDATDPLRDGKWLGADSWYSQPGNRPGFAYQVRADVTPEISRAVGAARSRSATAARPLAVTVANVQAGRGFNRHGAWTLVVMWESPTAEWRNLTLFDGFAFVQVQAGQQLVVGPLDFSGFETPASGAVDAHVATWTYEGDRTITGDYLALGRLNTPCANLAHLSNALNPSNNFFNSTISADGQEVGGRVPGFSNQLGFDLDGLALKEGTIPNGSGGASVCLGTTGDTYFFGGIAFDTLIRAPNAHIDKSAEPATAGPGDLVTYTVALTNPSRVSPPTAALTNVVTDDPLPSGVDFNDLTTNPGGHCSYQAAKRTIHCDVGTVGIDGSFTYTYRVRVSAAAQGTTSPTPLTNAACYRANSEDQQNVEFYGCDDATVLVPPNPFVDLGIVKTVSADIVAPGAPVTWTLTATNHGPGVSTGFVVADQLPPGVAFAGVQATPPLACTAPAPGASGAVTCTAPSVPAAPAAGSTLTVTITATVPGGAANGDVLRNVATVDGDQPEPTPDPNANRDSTSSRVVLEPPTPTPEPPTPEPPTPTPTPTPPTPVPPAPPAEPDPAGPDQPPVPVAGAGIARAALAGTRLTLSKRVLFRARVAPGATVRFRLRVRNAGEASARNVRVCDRLPRALTLVSAPGLPLRAGRTLCARIPVLGIGARRDFFVRARVALNAHPFVRNLASANATNALRVTDAAVVLPILARLPCGSRAAFC